MARYRGAFQPRGHDRRARGRRHARWRGDRLYHQPTRCGVIGALLLAAVLGGTATGLGAPALAHDLALGHTTVTITPAIGFVIEAVLALFSAGRGHVAGRAGNLAPLAIGMTLTLNIMMGGGPQPARALGPIIATGDLSNAWLYVAAPIVGALAAAIVHMGIAGLAAQPATAQARVPASSPAE